MNEETKKCPYCGMEILAVAKKCRFCGEWLDGSHRDNVTPQTGAPQQTPTRQNNHPLPQDSLSESLPAEKPVKVNYSRFSRMFKIFMWAAIVVSVGYLLKLSLGIDTDDNVDVAFFLMPWDVLPAWFTTLVEGFVFCMLMWGLKEHNKTLPKTMQTSLVYWSFWMGIVSWVLSWILILLVEVKAIGYYDAYEYFISLFLVLEHPMYILMVLLGVSILRWRKYGGNNTDPRCVGGFGVLFIVYGGLSTVLGIWALEEGGDLNSVLSYLLDAMLFLFAYRFFKVHIVSESNPVERTI